METTTVREAKVVYSTAPCHAGPPIGGKVECADRVVKLIRDAGLFPSGDMRERFIALGLNARNIVESWSLISVGTLCASLVHPREVFRAAVGTASAAIILVHNHPSGLVDPSMQDDAVTARMSQAGHILGIPVLDHIVVGDDLDYYSYREQNSDFLNGEVANYITGGARA